MDYENMTNIEAVETEVDYVEGETEKTGMGTVVAMAIGAGLAAASGAAVVFGKKLWAKYKAHKELRKPDEHIKIEPDDDDVKSVTEEE